MRRRARSPWPTAPLLDYESATSHAITVRVTDQAGLTFDKTFTIKVTNINEAPTNATLSGGTVAENSATARWSARSPASIPMRARC